MDLTGKTCTLHPFSTDGIALPKRIDFGQVARTFYAAVGEELERAGLGMQLAAPDEPDQSIVITGRFVQASAGNRLKRYLAPFLAGAAAVVEVEGVVANAGIPLETFTVLGRRGLGPFGGSSPVMINGAAELAGRDVARKTIAILVGP